MRESPIRKKERRVAKEFIDTNIVVYANDAADLRKQGLAIGLIRRLIETGIGVVSTQVMMEYAAVATRKLGQPRDAVTRQLLNLERLEVVLLTGTLIRNGLEQAASLPVSFWDSVIISAAQSARCDCIWSEDLSEGRFYAGVEIRNPFLE
jgi:predicted nucleic acid-binding protein